MGIEDSKQRNTADGYPRKGVFVVDGFWRNVCVCVCGYDCNKIENPCHEQSGTQNEGDDLNSMV